MPSNDQPNFHVVRTEIDDDGNFFPILSFRAADGKIRTLRVPMGYLAEPGKAKVALANKGAILPPDMSSLLAHLQSEVPTSQKQSVTTRGGWHGDAFVTSRLSVTGESGDMAFDQSDSVYRPRTRKGKFSKFKAGITRFLKASDFLVFAYLIGLTPCFASRIGRTESFALAFRQQSTTGKTLCLSVAQSLYAVAEEKSLWRFSQTQGVLLNSLPAMGGLCVPFMDIKTALDSKETAHKIHSLIFADARDRIGDPSRAQPQFFVPALSAETPIRDLLVSNGVPFEDGEAVRLMEIPVPDRAQGGIFAGSDHPAMLARELAKFLNKQHGTVLFQWVKKLQKMDVNLLDGESRVREDLFIRKLGTLPHHHARLAKHFALVAAVAMVAVKHKTIPVGRRRCLEVVTRMFRLAAAELASSEEEIASSWREFFALCENRRLLPAAIRGRAVNAGELGFIRDEGGQRIIYISQRGLTRTLGYAFVTRFLIPRLREARMLPASGETTRAVSQAGLPRVRYLRLDNRDIHSLQQQVLS